MVSFAKSSLPMLNIDLHPCTPLAQKSLLSYSLLVRSPDSDCTCMYRQSTQAAYSHSHHGWQPAFCSTLLIKNIKKHYQAYKTTFNTKSREVALPYANITPVKVESIQK